jgi:cysteine sulfinate desulfinase/cysteine desulfurase-like protein
MPMSAGSAGGFCSSALHRVAHRGSNHQVSVRFLEFSGHHVHGIRGAGGAQQRFVGGLVFGPQASGPSGGNTVLGLVVNALLQPPLALCSSKRCAA